MVTVVDVQIKCIEIDVGEVENTLQLERLALIMML